MNKTLIVIVTFNAMRWIERCLSSVQSSQVAATAFVIDNGSNDGTQDYIKRHYPQVLFQQSEENLGFGRANNIGLRYALDNDFDYVYLLNQDAWIYPDTIGELIKLHNKYPDYGILSPFQMNANGKIDRNFYSRIVSSDIFQSLYNDQYNNELKEIYEVPSIMAAHWFMPIGTVKKIGGFSPSFPHYGEDDNYSDRTRYYKLKIGIVPQLKVIHDRAFREETKDRIIYNGFTTSIYYLNNPFVPLYPSIFIAVRIALSNSIHYLTIRPLIFLIRIIFNIRDYRKNRMSSMNIKSAFLNNNK